MEYFVKTIADTNQMNECDPFPIASFNNWGCKYRPHSFGCMGYIQHRGLFIKMVCQEQDPAHIYYKHNDPVYLDSALEVFLQFGSKNSAYFNFEMNSNGALLAEYGLDRTHRTKFSHLTIQQFQCSAGRREEYWYTNLLIPFDALSEFEDVPYLSKGDNFQCNFYKVKESLGDTHFASWNPIDYPEPNFHLPQFFGRATIV